MIAFVQPFGLGAHGGGARILRSLVGDAPSPYLIVSTAPWRPTAAPTARDVFLPRRPAFGRLEGTRLAPWLAHADTWFGPRFEARLEALCREQGVRVLHAIPHGPEFWHAFVVARRLGLRYALNVHDDLPYNLPGAPYLGWALDRLGDAWRGADARFVISEAMGEAFTARYGAGPHRVVTDGLEAVAAGPQERPARSLRVYLMGSIHLSYEANFDALFEALRRLRADDPARPVHVVTRGGFPFPVRNGDVPVEVRPWGTQADVEADLAEADLLYLPLPFDARHDGFARYSLATKLVTYLGSGLPVLYHGPPGTAAGGLLAAADAALLAHDLDPAALARVIDDAMPRRERLAANALALARERFLLADQRRAFWGALLPLLDGPAAVRRKEPAERLAPVER